MTDHRPLFVAGPLPLDIGVGYDISRGVLAGLLLLEQERITSVISLHPNTWHCLMWPR